MKLDREHILLIENHLRKEHELSNQDFIDEMVDHYACALEEKANTSKNFQEVVSETDMSLGGKSGLKEMEKKYKKELSLIISKQYRSILHSYFIKFPQNLLTVLIFLTIYFIFSDEHRNLESMFITISILPIIIGFISLLIGVLYYLIVIKSSNKYVMQLTNIGILTINISNLRFIFQYLSESLIPIVFLATLMIIMCLVCLQVIYETYPKLKRRAIA